MAEIVLEKITKHYGDGQPAVDDLDLEIRDGEFMVLVGPSGCGKSTALRMIAGLETISGGQVKIDGRVVNDVPPKDRDIAMVFQNYALYPHMSVYDNMAFGLKLGKLDKAEIDKRVKEAAKVLGLDEFLPRKPRALSGGQRQRVAMGRAIVREPHAFLMDEPLSNLDAKLRVQMRTEIARIQNDLNVTTVYVTHDQIEAMTMGDRVTVLKKGKLQQVGTPKELFEQPVNLFVAGFIGSPAMNFASTKIEGDGDLSFKLGDATLTIAPEALAGRKKLRDYVGKDVIVGLRPQDFEDSAIASDSPRDCRLTATPDLVEGIGTETLIHFVIDAPLPLTDEVKELAADVGGEEVAQLERRADEGNNLFVARLDPRTEATQGKPIELTVDTGRLHFFDPDSGLNILDRNL